MKHLKHLAQMHLEIGLTGLYNNYDHFNIIDN